MLRRVREGPLVLGLFVPQKKFYAPQGTKIHNNLGIYCSTSVTRIKILTAFESGSRKNRVDIKKEADKGSEIHTCVIGRSIDRGDRPGRTAVTRWG